METAHPSWPTSSASRTPSAWLDQHDHVVLDAAREHAVAYVPYFPLGSAFPGLPKVTDRPGVQAVASSERGATPARSGWPGCWPGADNVLLIPGTSSVAHLEENLAAGHLTLSDDDLARMEPPSADRPA